MPALRLDTPAVPAPPSFVAGLWRSISERLRRGRRAEIVAATTPAAATTPVIEPLASLLDRLQGRLGEAARVALAGEILDRFAALDEAAAVQFLTVLAEQHGPDLVRLDQAIDAYRAEPGARTAALLHAAAEPRRQEILRRLNFAPFGTEALVRMREILLRQKAPSPALRALDADFVHLFSSWFNRGFLVLREIDWSTPASILEKIIRYEAVHEIRDWADLRRRLQPVDRRCYGFFHPRLPDEPLIFVEVALTGAWPDNIADLITEAPRQSSAAPDTAVFYSISNCQAGLKGISFGDFLIKQVVEELRRELPQLSTFTTLSPVPGLAAWLRRELEAPTVLELKARDRALLQRLGETDWQSDPDNLQTVRPLLEAVSAAYLVEAKASGDRPADPVARFHLGNGARLQQINFLGDRSARGLRESHGVMVNYLYDLGAIAENHEAFMQRGEIAAADELLGLARKHRLRRRRDETSPPTATTTKIQEG